jgi:hypothetical protein
MLAILVAWVEIDEEGGTHGEVPEFCGFVVHPLRFTVLLRLVAAPLAAPEE